MLPVTTAGTVTLCLAGARNWMLRGLATTRVAGARVAECVVVSIPVGYVQVLRMHVLTCLCIDMLTYLRAYACYVYSIFWLL